MKCSKPISLLVPPFAQASGTDRRSQLEKLRIVCAATSGIPFNCQTSFAIHCACDLQVAKATPPPQPEVSQLATAEEVRKKAPDAKPNTQAATVETPPAKEEPVYQVFMPPLIYDANAKVQPEVDPKMIVLVRRVRVRPALIFQGRVEGEAAAAVTPAPVPASTPAAAANAPKPAAPSSDTFVDRVRNFVRKLWPSG